MAVLLRAVKSSDLSCKKNHMLKRVTAALVFLVSYLEIDLPFLESTEKKRGIDKKCPFSSFLRNGSNIFKT
jgi:hypothetical protein